MNKYLYFFLTLLLIGACKKDPNQSISVCASQFDNVIDLHVKYCVIKKDKRSFVYRAEGNQSFEILKEINPIDIMGDSLFFVDSTLVKSGNYTYKVSYGGVLSPVAQVNFSMGSPSFYIPNSVKDTLRINSNYTCAIYSFQLYNRWGQLIIDAQNLSGNQSFDVSTQPRDTYIYNVILGKRKIQNTIGFKH
jgi:hypothetical protein